MIRKSSATITFHASHNYGSSLQAYALQQIIKSLGVDNKIINFRTPRQRDIYSIFTKRKGLKYLLKNITHLLYYRALCEKNEKFETFIREYLSTTEDVFLSSEDIRKKCSLFDYYIAGSDQIWNPVPFDFDWAYYLEFVTSGKKISYAPSFGPLSSLGDQAAEQRISDNLNTFNVISVREKKSANLIKNLLGKDVPVVCDPTLLIGADDWKKLAADGLKIGQEYIFLYTLFANPEIMKIAKMLSKKLLLPVVISNFSNQYDIINGFDKRYNAGPKDFLALIQNAKFVLASSFHGTVFSILFQKPFFAIHGMKDARISTLLQNFGLESRAVDLTNFDEKCLNAYDVDYSHNDVVLRKLRDEGIAFLKAAMEVSESDDMRTR